MLDAAEDGKMQAQENAAMVLQGLSSFVERVSGTKPRWVVDGLLEERNIFQMAANFFKKQKNVDLNLVH